MKTLLSVLSVLFFINFLQAQDLVPFEVKGPNYSVKYGYKDSSGTIIVEPKYDKAAKFSEGLAMVTLAGKHGCIDNKGAEVIPLIYDDTKWFSEGLMAVNKGATSVMGMPGVKGGKWGFIDKKGKEVVPFKYELAEYFKDGLAAVRVNGRWGFIDKTGKQVVPGIYEEVKNFSEGFASVRRVLSNEEIAAAKIDTTGLRVITRWTFIDKKGKEILKPVYLTSGYFYDGLLAMSIPHEKWRDGAYGFVDYKGKTVIPFQFRSTYGFSEGLAPVMSETTWGYIDKKGKIVIPFKYQTAYRFSKGAAQVSRDNITYMIDKNGKETVKK